MIVEQFLVYANDVNILVGSVNTVTGNKNTESPVATVRRLD